MLFQKNVPVARKLGFPDVIMPGERKREGEIFVAKSCSSSRGRLMEIVTYAMMAMPSWMLGPFSSESERDECIVLCVLTKTEDELSGFVLCMVLSGDLRNDLYVTLVRGEYLRDGKKAQKNVQAEVSIIGQNGKILAVSCVVFPPNVGALAI